MYMVSLALAAIKDLVFLVNFGISYDHGSLEMCGTRDADRVHGAVGDLGNFAVLLVRKQLPSQYNM